MKNEAIYMSLTPQPNDNTSRLLYGGFLGLDCWI